MWRVVFYNPPLKHFTTLKKIFAISDLWLNRPFGKHYGVNHLEYNRNVIEKWNETVSEDDTVFILGGFGICDLYNYLYLMKGNIVFLNNFYSKDERESISNIQKFISERGRERLFERITFNPNQIIVLYDKDVVLSYFPLSDWYGKSADSICFHGMNGKTNMNDNTVCCNASEWDFKPVDITEVVSNFKKFKQMV